MEERQLRVLGLLKRQQNHVCHVPPPTQAEDLKVQFNKDWEKAYKQKAGDMDKVGGQGWAA